MDQRSGSSNGWNYLMPHRNIWYADAVDQATGWNSMTVPTSGKDTWRIASPPLNATIATDNRKSQRPPSYLESERFNLSTELGPRAHEKFNVTPGSSRQKKGQEWKIEYPSGYVCPRDSSVVSDHRRLNNASNFSSNQHDSINSTTSTSYLSIPIIPSSSEERWKSSRTPPPFGGNENYSPAPFFDGLQWRSAAFVFDDNLLSAESLPDPSPKKRKSRRPLPKYPDHVKHFGNTGKGSNTVPLSFESDWQPGVAPPVVDGYRRYAGARPAFPDYGKNPETFFNGYCERNENRSYTSGCGRSNAMPFHNENLTLFSQSYPCYNGGPVATPNYNDHGGTHFDCHKRASLVPPVSWDSLGRPVHPCVTEDITSVHRHPAYQFSYYGRPNPIPSNYDDLQITPSVINEHGNNMRSQANDDSIIFLEARSGSKGKKAATRRRSAAPPVVEDHELYYSLTSDNDTRGELPSSPDLLPSVSDDHERRTAPTVGQRRRHPTPTVSESQERRPLTHLYEDRAGTGRKNKLHLSLSAYDNREMVAANPIVYEDPSQLTSSTDEQNGCSSPDFVKKYLRKPAELAVYEISPQSEASNDGRRKGSMSSRTAKWKGCCSSVRASDDN